MPEGRGLRATNLDHERQGRAEQEQGQQTVPTVDETAVLEPQDAEAGLLQRPAVGLHDVGADGSRRVLQPLTGPLRA